MPKEIVQGGEVSKKWSNPRRGELILLLIRIGKRDDEVMSEEGKGKVYLTGATLINPNWGHVTRRGVT